MRIINPLLLTFAIALCLVACQDIVEPNLAKTTISALGPSNGVSTTSNAITFWWDPLNGATNYRITAVSPSFSNVTKLVFDTVITGTKFNYSFLPGRYQWRLRAQNGSSYTPYATYNLTIDTTSNLSSQQVLLLSPANNSASNQNKQVFLWTPLALANQYTIEIYDSTNALIYTKALITSDTSSYSFSKDGKYHWDVKAQNSTSITSSVQTFYFSLNRTIPNPPSLTYPTYNDTASSPVHLTWTRNSNNISYDSLAIASDSLFKYPILQTKTITNSYTYSYSAAVGTVYFWKVKSIDNAGNSSSWANWSKFKTK